jgi:hypothetical protein
MELSTAKAIATIVNHMGGQAEVFDSFVPINTVLNTPTAAISGTSPTEVALAMIQALQGDPEHWHDEVIDLDLPDTFRTTQIGNAVVLF